MEFVKKREDIISWDEYFLTISFVVGLRSKDPNTQVGCILVDDSNRIISTGYNGLAEGLKDDNYNWTRDVNSAENKYLFVIHAEQNALLNCLKQKNEVPSKLYVSIFPCSQCTKLIIQSKIKELYYGKNPYADSNDVKIASKMLAEANIKVISLEHIDITKILKKIA